MFIRSAAAVLLSVTAFSAHATGTLFRTYLSANGNDANPCTVSAPCRLLPAALAQTADQGEVWMVDSANYNTGTVTISQNVTILAVPGALGSLVANNSRAVYLPSANVKVTLRNLLIRNLAGNTNYGVIATGANVQLIVEGSEFSGLNEGILVFGISANLIVHNSVFRNTYFAIEIEGGPSQIAHGLVDHCTMVGSGGVAVLVSDGTMTVSHSTVTQSSEGVQALSGSQILLEDNQITQNTTGVTIGGNGIVQTTGTNNIKFNGTKITGGPLTSVSRD